MSFLTPIWNNPLTRYAAGIILAIIGISVFGRMKKREGRKQRDLEAAVAGEQKLTEIRRDLDDRIEKAEESARDLPEFDAADSVPDDIASIIFADR